MGRLRDDRGLSLSELLVVTALMGLVLGVVYMGIDFAYRAQAVSEEQAHFAREVAAPMRVIDQSFSQSMVPPAGTANDGYRVTLRMPLEFDPSGRVIEHDYEVTANGRLLQHIYQVVGANRTLIRTVTWSTANRNRALSRPAFTYFAAPTPGASQQATDNVGAADSVQVELHTAFGDNAYSDKRLIHFRNR
jgi:prepilin-type N-terminal cleavage/methylation domain-containing protein